MSVCGKNCFHLKLKLMYAWPPNLIPQVMQSAECSWGTSRVSSRYIDWWYCIGTLKVVGVGGHGSMVYTCDAGFHCWHQGVLQGAQIGGIVLAPCQPLPGCWGWALTGHRLSWVLAVSAGGRESSSPPQYHRTTTYSQTRARWILENWRSTVRLCQCPVFCWIWPIWYQ